MIKNILHLIFLLSFSFSGRSSVLEKRLDYAQNLNRVNDAEMLRISDSISDVYVNSSRVYKPDEFYRAAYLKARVLNRTGKLEHCIEYLDSIQNHHQNPKPSLYFGYTYLIKGIAYKKEANPALAFEHYEQAIHIFETIQDCKALVKARNNLANYYNSLSIYEAAIEQYKHCADLLQSCPNAYQQAIINRNLAGLYFNFEKKPEQALVLFKEALSGFRNLEQSSKTEQLSLGTLNQMTLLHLKLNQLNEAQIYLNQSLKLIKKETPKKFIYNYKLNQANLLIKNKRFSDAQIAFQTIQDLIDSTAELQNYEARFYIEYAEFAFKQNTKIANQSTENLLAKALSLAQAQGKIELQAQIALIKSKLYKRTKRFRQALAQHERYVEWQEQLFNAENIKALQSAKYQLDFIRKENELDLERRAQQEAIQQSLLEKNELEKENLRISSIALLMFAALIVILFWWYAQRKKTSINKLVLESKNKALELQLSNREREEEYKLFQNSVASKKEEQNRISRNLHDNIGANLAAIKLALDDKDKAFGNLIDDVYQEVRNLSYELNVLSENKDLFHQIIQNYLESIESASGIKIHYEVYPDVDFERFHSVEKRELFSIIREIVHNSIRHSGSKNMELIFSKEEDNLHFYFEDFGSGFDSKSTPYGLGLINIQKRIDILKGSFELDARAGRGVIINLSIPF
ncbi:MAG: tetratricopeptide repeat-containing sensor histidine kinase [Flavobacteriales bacterium]